MKVFHHLNQGQKETQILDASEIENIKGILTEDTSDDLSLEDLMPPMSVMPSIMEPVVEEQKETKENENKTELLNLDSNVLAQTLAAMPVENLRQLLAGATVKIKMKFPKLKK